MNIREWISEYNDKALCADGFDEAILGVAIIHGGDYVVAYDRERCIQILMDEFEPTLEDGEDLYTIAVEYFEYNVAGSYVGEFTPMFIQIPDQDEIDTPY